MVVMQIEHDQDIPNQLVSGLNIFYFVVLSQLVITIFQMMSSEWKFHPKFTNVQGVAAPHLLK